MEIEIGKLGMAGIAGIKMRVEVEFVYLDKEEMIRNKKGERIQLITPSITKVLLTVDGVPYEGSACANPVKDRHCTSHWAGRKVALRRAMAAAKMPRLERIEVWCGLAVLGIRWGKRLGRKDRVIQRLRNERGHRAAKEMGRR